MSRPNTPEMGSNGPSAPDLPTQILSHATADLTINNKVFEIINNSRRSTGKPLLRITPPGESYDRLQDQLHGPAGQAAMAAVDAGHLLHTSERPLMVVSPLSGPITDEELVTAISKSSKHGIYPWNKRLEFLGKFPLNALTGYNEADAENNTLSLLETGYDTRREGPTYWQREGPNGLNEARQFNPRIGVAPILAAATLGQRLRYSDQQIRQDTQVLHVNPNTYTRIISDSVHVEGYGHMVVASATDTSGYPGPSMSRMSYPRAARRWVALEA